MFVGYRRSSVIKMLNFVMAELCRSPDVFILGVELVSCCAVPHGEDTQFVRHAQKHMYLMEWIHPSP